LFFQSGDDTEELNQDLNGNQNYDDGDLEMEVGLEGKLSNIILIYQHTVCNYLQAM